MTDSREGSPDWLRAFQAPSRDLVMLSSDSDSPPENSSSKSAHSNQQDLGKGKEKNNSVLSGSEEDGSHVQAKKPKKAKSKARSILEEDASEAREGRPAEEDVKEKPGGQPVSQRLPLVFHDKVQRSKALIECDGKSIDLSGDVGAVGRIVISNGPTGNNEMLLDLKGTIYKTTILPSRTFCIVSIGQSDAKIEAIMNDFVQLEPQSNLFEAETMVEGTLDGFSFDSEEEGGRAPESFNHQNDQDHEKGQLPKAKTKRKIEKSLGQDPKKTKRAERPPRKGTRKNQPVKRTKKAKK